MKPLRVVLKDDRVLVGLVDIPPSGEIVFVQVMVAVFSNERTLPLSWKTILARFTAGPCVHRSASTTGGVIRTRRSAAKYSHLERRDDFTQVALDYQGAFGRVNQETNTNKHYATGGFDFSSHTYLIPLFACSTRQFQEPVPSLHSGVWVCVQSIPPASRWMLRLASAFSTTITLRMRELIHLKRPQPAATSSIDWGVHQLLSSAEAGLPALS